MSSQIVATTFAFLSVWVLYYGYPLPPFKNLKICVMNMNATVHEMDIWSILSSQCHNTCKVTAVESLIGVGGGVWRHNICQQRDRNVLQCQTEHIDTAESLGESHVTAEPSGGCFFASTPPPRACWVAGGGWKAGGGPLPPPPPTSWWGTPSPATEHRRTECQQYSNIDSQYVVFVSGNWKTDWMKQEMHGWMNRWYSL